MTNESPQIQRTANPSKTPSLVYRVRKSRVASVHDKTPLLILLHGFGSNEDDLLGLSAYLDERFTMVSARAPYTLAPGSYAWYAVEFRQDGLALDLDLDQAEESRKQLVQFITEVRPTLEAGPEQVYLMGFSQGAAMTASVLLTRPDLLAGAVLMSGHILPDVEKHTAEADQLKDKPVFVVHGECDPLLPVGEGRASRDLLQSLGLSVTYREYPMAHQVTDESLEDVDRWLSERLNV